MKPDFDREPLSVNFRTPCPGCGEPGDKLLSWETPHDGRPIQLMDCPKPREECRVQQYYPEEAEA